MKKKSALYEINQGFFLPIFPFSVQHQYSTAEKVISTFRAIKATTKNKDSKPEAKAFIDSARKYFL